MVACKLDWIAGKATPTTVPSIKTMLEPRMVAAKIQGPLAVPPFRVVLESAVSDTTLCCTLRVLVEVGLLE
jgi:hypothetical protein